eukprot:1142465-Pelagomonas_calceolata.AAC.2
MGFHAIANKPDQAPRIPRKQTAGCAPARNCLLVHALLHGCLQIHVGLLLLLLGGLDLANPIKGDFLHRLEEAGECAGSWDGRVLQAAATRPLLRSPPKVNGPPLPIFQQQMTDCRKQPLEPACRHARMGCFTGMAAAAPCCLLLPLTCTVTLSWGVSLAAAPKGFHFLRSRATCGVGKGRRPGFLGGCWLSESGVCACPEQHRTTPTV